nr:TIGR03085 family protein [Propionibacterium sp.]
MRHAPLQRRAFSDALLEVGPSAPTLCEGWTAHDLAAHCWVREHNPTALLGIASKRFEHLAEGEMAKVKQRMGFVELATRLADTPRTPITLVPAADEAVNTVEYLIHTEDVRRANGLPKRLVPPDLEVALWRRLGLVGRLLFRGGDVGVVLEQAGSDAAPLRVKAGSATVTLVGRPSELLLFAFGREQHADVRLVGEQRAIDALLAAKRGA